MRGGTRLQLAELIRKTSRGDRAAFAMLYALTAAQLFGVAQRITRQREDAEEVLQESFVAVWQRSGDYDPAMGSAIGWLTAIVRHRAIDYGRRRASRPEGRLGPEELLLELIASDRSDRDAELRSLQRCLAELGEQPRKAVLLAYCYGLTREEIAASLTVPLGTAKSWIRRSLEALRRCLDQ